MEFKLIMLPHRLILVSDEEIPYNPNGTEGNFFCMSEVLSNIEYGVKEGEKQYVSPFIKNVGNCKSCRRIIAGIPELPSIDFSALSEDDCKKIGFNKFSSIPHEILKTVAELSFCGDRKWVTSDISVRYNPYIIEHYEDAQEYFEMTFEGYFAGEKTARYRINLYPNFDLALWFNYKDKGWEVLHLSSQSKVQELLQPFKTAQSHEKKFSEEDLRKAIEMARDCDFSGAHGIDYDYTEEQIIQSLSQPKVFDVEVEWEDWGHLDMEERMIERRKLIPTPKIRNNSIKIVKVL